MYMNRKKFDQIEYINCYNRENYKMYQFRVKRDNKLIGFLDNMNNRNNYIVSVIEKDCNVLPLSKIKKQSCQY